MKRSTIVACALSAVVLVLATVRAEPAKDKSKTPKTPKTPFVYVPYSKLTLTPEQRQQIGDINREYAAKIKALRDEEKAKIMPLLSEDQKAQLAKMDEEYKARQKSNRGKNNESGED